MSETRPRLVALDADAREDAGAVASRPRERGEEPRSSRWVWALVAVLLVALALLAGEARRAARLEAQVVELEARVAAAEAQSLAWEQRMGEVRGALEGLESQLATVRRLASGEPSPELAD